MDESLVVVDVGVRGGPHPRWQPLRNRVQIIGVDADPAECARLIAEASGIPARYVHYALGRRDGEQATLHVTRQPGCSSLLAPNTEFLRAFSYGREFDVVKTVPVVLTSLDTMCDRERIVPDVIKLDTQGSELAILEGGARALEAACLVETEVEFNQVYSGQPLFGDIDSHMRRHGFALLGLRRDYFRRADRGIPSSGGTLMHGDALFYRVDLPPVQRNRFILALGAYRQWDFVAQLGGSVPDGPSSPLLQRVLGRALSTLQPHRRLRDWLDRSRPDGAIDWHDADFF